MKRTQPLPVHDYPAMLDLHRWWRREVGPPSGPVARIALLSTTTLTFLPPLLELCCWHRGLACEIHEAPHGTVFQEGLDPASSLHRFGPDTIIVLPHVSDVALPPVGGGDDALLLERALEPWKALWAMLGPGAVLLQGNYVVPPERPLGHLDAVVPGGVTRFVRRLNQHLADALPPGAVLHDTEHLAGCVGKNAWCDPVWWHGARMAASFDALPWVARSLAGLVAARHGRSRKCLVLDLDETLWRGVVADVGLEGIELGGSPAGRPHRALQQYARALRERGCLLAVCSRNDPEVALQPFREHADMVLREDDIACFVASFDDKASGLRRIASTLAIGLDALVFLDDNPAERALIRRELPEVAVVEPGDDPAGFVRALDQGGWFEALTLSGEDLERTEFYRSESRRREAAPVLGTTTDLEGYLRSLEMTVTTRPLRPVDVPRVTQLAGRTNQFNLTGLRPGEAEVSRHVGRGAHVGLTASVGDRFGELGLVAALLGTRRGSGLVIDVLVMSCRVLSRGVEDALFAAVVATCVGQGIDRIHGRFVPSGRNGLVRGLFARLGFGPGHPAVEADGVESWVYEVGSAIAAPPWLVHQHVDEEDVHVRRHP